MIIGTGVDIVGVADFAERLERKTILRVFSEAELAYAKTRSDKYVEILAARWAAKEAFGKALGTGLRLGWPLDQIEVKHAEKGRPTISLGPEIQSKLPASSIIHLSISHIPSSAIAFVVIETI